MFRIALCDDNHAFLEYEYNVICRYMTERNIEFQCNIFLSGQELIQKYKALEEYNLFILDYDIYYIRFLNVRFFPILAIL